MATTPSRMLAARIAGQSGLVTRAQALGGGVTRKAVECHLRAGRWVTIHPGVYLTTPGRDDWPVRATAALLWSGAGAALARTGAAYAWGLLRNEPSVVEVVVPANRLVRAVAGVRVTRSRHAMARVDPHAWPHRLTAAHTVFDLGRGAPVDQVVTLAARALDLRLCTSEQLRCALADRPNQAHRTVLSEALADVAAGAESPAEVRYARDVERRHGLPRGRRQVATGTGGRHDVEYEEFGLVVEVDGRLNHAGWAARQHDGRRDRAAALRGRLTVRCFWTDLVPTACAFAIEVSAILRARGWWGSARPCGPTCPLGRERSVPSLGA